MDINKKHKEKARWELYKNATSYVEQIPEATPHSCTSPYHPSQKPSKQYEQDILLEIQEWTRKGRSSMEPYI